MTVDPWMVAALVVWPVALFLVGATMYRYIAKWRERRATRASRETFVGMVETGTARTLDRMLTTAEKIAEDEGSHIIIVRMFRDGVVSAHEAMPEGGTKLLTDDGLTLEITPQKEKTDVEEETD